MADFNPDAYLSTKGFDPDSYLQSKGQSAPTNANPKAGLIDNIIDIAKGIGHGVGNVAVSIPNLPVTAHNFLHPQDTPMKDFVANRMPQPTTPLGHGADIAASIFSPNVIGKVAGAASEIPVIQKLLEGLSNADTKGKAAWLGIPKEIVNFVKDNPTSLAGNFNKQEEFSDLGKKLMANYTNTMTSAGKDVGAAKLNALIGKSAGKPIPSSIAASVRDAATPYAGRTAGEAGGLVGREQKLVDELSGMLSPISETKTSKILGETGAPITETNTQEATVQQLANAHRRLRESIASWGEGSGNDFLKNLDNTLSGELEKRVPGYAGAMDQYSALQDYKKMVGSGALKPENIESTVKNIGSKTLMKQDVFKSLTGLDDNDLKTLLARDFYNMPIPARGYTTGGEQGIGNYLRGVITASTPTLPGKAAVVASFSPIVHKNAILAVQKLLPLIKSLQGAAGTVLPYAGAAQSIGGNQ